MPITLTPVAAEEVKKHMADKELSSESFLRLGIAGGGCSGLQYAISVGDDFNPETETKVEQHGVTVVASKKMYLHLDATTIDFTEGPAGKGFAIDNPNVPKGGGCPGCGGG